MTHAIIACHKIQYRPTLLPTPPHPLSHFPLDIGMYIVPKFQRTLMRITMLDNKETDFSSDNTENKL